MHAQTKFSMKVIICLLVVACGTSAPAATLSGRVYEGSKGDESTPLPGVVVRLYGANGPAEPRTQIAGATTDATGWYGLPGNGYEFYYIVAEGKAGYTFVDSASVGGTASGTEIRYDTISAPLEDQTLTGNRFWYRKEGEEPPPPDENRQPVAVDDSASTAEGTRVDIDVLTNDSDPDGDPLHVMDVADAAHGSTFNYITHVSYTPDLGYSGPDAFSYTVGDGRGGMATALVTVDVSEADEPEPPEDRGVLAGFKRDADTGEGLAGWRIFIDVNGNDSWDADEPSGVSDENGYYRIDDVEPGTYRVCEEMQAGWHSDHPCVEGIAILAGATTTQDFHNRQAEPPAGTGAIRGVKFHDLNGNGRRDPGEPGLPGWEIILEDLEGNRLAGTTTDASGHYEFVGLEPGAYRVDEVLQAGWRQTAPIADGGAAFWLIELGPDQVAGETDFGNTEEDAPPGPDHEEEHGDAPQPYSDFFLSVSSTVLLGARVDGEPVMQRDPHALGDDHNDGSDDEDGVEFSTPLIPGRQATVRIDLGAVTGPEWSVRGWVDFDGDGSFGTTEDVVEPSASLAAGTVNTLTFTVPANARPGRTFARFYIVDTGPEPPWGIPQGEVEDYEVFIGDEGPGPGNGEYDFGDAPDSYGTRRASGGPYHDVGEVRMGNLIDPEPDGQPGPQANLDDITATDDEDGVALMIPMTVGAMASVKVDIMAPTGVPAAVAGWVDFDHSGTFEDPGERIASGVYTGVGVPVPWTETFQVPADALGGETCMRFRIYRTEPGVDVVPSPDGYGGEGEVEDYLVYILSDAPGPDDGRDYGDAPVPYPDASHDLGGPWMGNVPPDAEGATQASPTASGDDNAETDDEDAVQFVGDIVPGTVTVLGWKTTAATGPLSTAAWIDFNRDGDWDDAGEHLGTIWFNSAPGQSAYYSIGFLTPTDASIGKTYARVRVYAAASDTIVPSPSGHGGPGELEDYEVEIKADGQTLPPGQIVGGMKFHDLNGNGVFDAGEPGLGGWTVWVDVNGNGVKDAGEATLTNPDGTFFLAALKAGSYTVYEEMQPGWTQTFPGGTGTHTITVQAGKQTPAILFGNQRAGHPSGGLDYGDAPASYGVASHDVGAVHLGPTIDSEGQALHSPNADGDDLDKNDDEDGVTFISDLVRGRRAGISIQYYYSQNPPLGHIPDVAVWIDYNQDGVFHSTEERVNWTGGMVMMLPTHYSIDSSFSVPATAKLGRTFMRVRAAPNATPSPTGHGGLGEVEDYQVTIKADGDILPPGQIAGGVKFHDRNGNGAFDVGEPGLPGWTIWIDLNANGVKDAGEATLTNAAGSFLFTVLADGTYTVHEEMQPGWTQTFPGGAGTQTIMVQAGQQTTPIQFGNRRTGGSSGGGEIIHGYKWNDLDGDGLWDVAQPVEPPLAGWTIWLDRNGNGVQDAGDTTTQTDAQGHFIFPPVPSGTYVLGEVQQSGWTQTTPTTGTHTVTVQGGQGSHPMLFGNRRTDGTQPPPGGGYILAGKWHDLDGNGIWSVPAEPALPNWQIYLDLNENGQPDPGEPVQLTDSNGECRFTGLADGDYTVAEVIPPGWQQTSPGGAGTHKETVKGVSMASRLMFGNQQVGGPPPGTDLDYGDAPDSYRTLAASGGASHRPSYLVLGRAFDTEPDGVPTADAQGDDVAGLDDEEAVLHPADLILTAGQSRTLTLVVDNPDFGNAHSGTVTGWIDFNGDGQFQPGPESIGAQQITLAGGTVGQVQLAFTIPATAKIGATYARFRLYADDMNPNPTLSPTGYGQAGEVEDHRVEIKPGGAGRIVKGWKFDDQNANGKWDGPFETTGEPGLSGWTIWLDANHSGRREAGDPVAITDSGGYFEFTGLAAGTYLVGEEPQPGWTQTCPPPPGTDTVTATPTHAGPSIVFGNTQGAVDRSCDWGDAPDPTYATLDASGGASHVVVPGMHLGGMASGDLDGQPHPEALGDDLDGEDDEDGVFFLTPLMPGELAIVEVISPVAGRLDAWIDFEGDGAWSQAHDQVFTSEPILDGINTLTFPVPAGAAVEVPTYARFRFSSKGGLKPDGPAADGEVEDYQLILGEGGPGVPGQGDPPHVKWSQPPIEIDPNVEEPPVFCGWDEPARSTESSGQRRQWRMAADDFRCLGPIPITRIRWWGSYKAWQHPEPPERQPESWHIGIWANQVEGLAPEEAYLERLVWSLEVPMDRVHFEPVGAEEFPEQFPSMAYVYELALEPEEWFHQADFESVGDVFWITITAIYPPDTEQANMWGWLTRPHVWRDGAVTPAIFGEWPTHDERLFPGRVDPIERTSLCATGEMEPYDLCFELLTEEPWVKWDQPLVPLRDWPYASDRESIALEDDDGNVAVVQQVADDWVCTRRDHPVVAISWHGSYLGYGYEACKCDEMPAPRSPDYFLLSLWTNEPADPGDPLAHCRPGEKVWEYRAEDFAEVMVGYDGSAAAGQDEPNEPVFRYSLRLPEDAWFYQPDEEQVYWLSVVAAYVGPMDEVPHSWGWTDRPHEGEAIATFIDYRPAAEPQWRILRDPVDRGVDLSFELFTMP